MLGSSLGTIIATDVPRITKGFEISQSVTYLPTKTSNPQSGGVSVANR